MTNILCVACRDTHCSVDVRCNECNSWSVDFMLGYIKHQKIFVSKGKKKTPSFSSSSSPPSKPPAVQTTAPVAPPLLPASTEDQLKNFVHSFLWDFLPQSGQIGTNPLISAPPAVSNSASLLLEVARGLSADSLTGVPLTESSGKVLPMTQVDVPLPNINVHAVSFFLARGVGPLSLVSATMLGMTVRTNYVLVVSLWIPRFLLLLLCLPLPFFFLCLILVLLPFHLLFPLLLLLLLLLVPLLVLLFLFLSLFLPPFLLLCLLLFPLLCLLLRLFFLLFLILLFPLFCLLGRGVPVPPPPPGFPMSLSSSSLPSYPYSHPVSSSSLLAPPPPLASSIPSSPFLPAFSLAPLSASAPTPSLAPVSSSSSSFSSPPSSSSSLDFAAYKAHVLGLSDEYLSFARWFVGVGGSDFLSFLSSHCPHLSADASCDFSSGCFFALFLFLRLQLRLLFLLLVFPCLFLILLPPLLLLFLLSLLGFLLWGCIHRLLRCFLLGSRCPLPPPPFSVPALSSSFLVSPSCGFVGVCCCCCRSCGCSGGSCCCSGGSRFVVLSL